MKNFIKLFSIIVLFFFTFTQSQSAEKVDYLKTDWSFKGLFGKFDRGSLQRGYQVYTEVCASCHSMKYLSYRNLGENHKKMFRASCATRHFRERANARRRARRRPIQQEILFEKSRSRYRVYHMLLTCLSTVRFARLYTSR